MIPDDFESQGFSEAAFVRAHLLKQPLYPEDGKLWEVLLASRDELIAWFRQTGLELIVDTAEGYAFIRQIETLTDTKIPRLIQRRKLTYDATLLLVCLREELSRMEARDADQTRLIRTRREMIDLVSGFLPESNDETRDQKRVDAAIEQLSDLGFLKRLGSESADHYEICRIIKARLGPAELEAIKLKLQNHVGN